MAKIVLDIPDFLTPCREEFVFRSLLSSADFKNRVLVAGDLVTYRYAESERNCRAD